MSTSKVKKMTRAKKIDFGKADEFISGADDKGNGNNMPREIENPLPVGDETPLSENVNLDSDEMEKEADENTIEKYPWEDANERIIKGVNLRLNEVQWAKLRYIVDNTPFSIQKFVMSILEPAIEDKVKEIQQAK